FGHLAPRPGPREGARAFADARASGSQAHRLTPLAGEGSAGGEGKGRHKKPGRSRVFHRTAMAPQAAALAALMRAFRRALWRAALFLWIRPRELKRSRIGWATL